MTIPIVSAYKDSYAELGTTLSYTTMMKIELPTDIKFTSVAAKNTR